MIFAERRLIQASSRFESQRGILVHITDLRFIGFGKVFDGKIEIFQDVCKHDFPRIAPLIQLLGIHLQFCFIPRYIAETLHFVYILPGTEETNHSHRTVYLFLVTLHAFVAVHKIVAGTDISPVSASPSATGSRNRFKVENPGLRFLVHVTVRFVIGTGALRSRQDSVKAIGIKFEVLHTCPEFRVGERILRIQVQQVRARSEHKSTCH